MSYHSASDFAPEAVSEPVRMVLTVLPYKLTYFEMTKQAVINNMNALVSVLFYSPRKVRFFSYCQTSGTTVSIVCDNWHAKMLRRLISLKDLKPTTTAWRAIQISEGTNMTTFQVESGLVSSISGELSKNGYSIFYLSTDSSDYVLVRADQFEPAMEVLRHCFNFVRGHWAHEDLRADIERDEQDDDVDTGSKLGSAVNDENDISNSENGCVAAGGEGSADAAAQHKDNQPTSALPCSASSTSATASLLATSSPHAPLPDPNPLFESASLASIAAPDPDPSAASSSWPRAALPSHQGSQAPPQEYATPKSEAALAGNWPEYEYEFKLKLVPHTLYLLPFSSDDQEPLMKRLIFVMFMLDSPSISAQPRRVSRFLCYSDVDGDVSLLVDRQCLEILSFGNMARVLARATSSLSSVASSSAHTLYASNSQFSSSSSPSSSSSLSSSSSSASAAAVPLVIARCRELLASTVLAATPTVDASSVDEHKMGKDEQEEDVNYAVMEDVDARVDAWLTTVCARDKRREQDDTKNQDGTTSTAAARTTIPGEEGGDVDENDDVEENGSEYWSGRTWRVLRLDGSWGFDETGVVYSLSEPITRAGICPLYISTFHTDFMLVPQPEVRSAIKILRQHFNVQPDSAPR